MPKHTHTGNKTSRTAKTGKINPKNARHFIIVTDAKETEINYIQGLKKYLTDSGISIKIKQENTQTNLVEECRKLANTENYSYPRLWILFDYDNLEEFDRIIEEAKINNIQAAWSNPCFEIWMWAYFENIPESQTNSKQCIAGFKDIFLKHTNVGYKKNDNEIYRRLFEYGDEQQAIKRAEQLLNKYKQIGQKSESKMAPATNVHTLLKEIRYGYNDTENMN